MREEIDPSTISSIVDEVEAEGAFLDLHQFLIDAFPNVHASLKREVINEFSLLYTWEGNDPSLRPVLLSAHQDVVPVEPESEDDWTHPPFEGAIADGFDERLDEAGQVRPRIAEGGRAGDFLL